MLEREEAKRTEPNGYERGYFDGYHKGYSNKKSAVNAVEKKMKEEIQKRMETLEISNVYPFSMIYEITETDRPLMVSPETINRVLNEKLTERERRCLEMRHRDSMTLEDIGKQMNVTRERVRQIIARAERKLRNPKWIREMQVVPYAEFIELYNEHEILKAKYSELVSRIESEEQKSTDEVVHEQTIMEKPIEVLDLSVRSFNCLKRAGCDIIADVVDLNNSGKIYGVRNLGKRSAEEIRSKLKEVGL